MYSASSSAQRCRNAVAWTVALCSCCVATWRESAEHGGFVEFRVSDRTAEQHWPCCSVEQTQIFASVVGSGVPGVWHMDFDRDVTRRDLLWDVPFVAAMHQRVVLSGQAAHAATGIAPRWAPGYVVKSGAALSLAYMNTVGELVLESGAIGLNLTDTVVSAAAQLHGGVVRIVRSALEDGVQVRVGMVALDVLNSTMFADPTFDEPDSPPMYITITSSELRRWPKWASFANNTGVELRLSDVTVTLHTNLDDGRTTGSVLGVVNSCEGCTAGFEYACRPGFEGPDCIGDIDECGGVDVVSGNALNGGCEQICVNFPGSYSCKCNPGYQSIGDDSVNCEDIDECASTGCVDAPPIVRDCRATKNVSLIGSVEELVDCAGVQHSVAREECYESLKHPQFESFYSLNVSWVFVLPVVLGADQANTSVTMEHLDQSEMFLAMPRCDSFCTNFEGTYQCSCSPGFMLDEADGAAHTCRDVNECMDEGTGDPCLSYANSKCVNTVGGVTCACQEGYQGWPIGPAGDGVNASACNSTTGEG